MKEVVVISGKGGTGKTTVAASSAVLAGRCVVADTDVDAPNLHLLLRPKIEQDEEVVCGKVAVRSHDVCQLCGRCRDTCRFDAIADDLAFSSLECEGCGVCALVCPTNAVSMVDAVSGHLYAGTTMVGPICYAKLLPGKGNSGKLVTMVRQKARSLAESNALDLLITDGPPGIGCPVISAVVGANLALIVTEPTVSGLHDLRRVLEVCLHFKVAAAVCINKSDLSPSTTKEIMDFCASAGVDVLGEIPYDTAVVEAIRAGVPLVSVGDTPAADAVRSVWWSAADLLAQVPDVTSTGTQDLNVNLQPHLTS
ncbi:MAG: ATP-binding protein [Armatimonadota bacterium]